MGSETSPTCSCQRPRGTVRLVISGCSTWPAACQIAPVRADNVEGAQPTGPSDSSHSPTLRRFPDRQPVVACVDRCMTRPKGRSGRGPHLERDARQHFSRSRADYRPPARNAMKRWRGKPRLRRFCRLSIPRPATSRLCSTPSSKRPTRYAGARVRKSERHAALDAQMGFGVPDFRRSLAPPFRAPINRIIGLRAFVRANETGF
jgi:hypothetical protein